MIRLLRKSPPERICVSTSGNDVMTVFRWNDGSMSIRNNLQRQGLTDIPAEWVEMIGKALLGTLAERKTGEAA